MSNVYPVTSTRRKKSAERGRETSLPGPYETCTSLFKTLTSKIAVLLYVAIFSVYGQAMAQCPTSAQIQASSSSICQPATATPTGVTLVTTVGPNATDISGAIVRIFRNGVLIHTSPTLPAGSTSYTYVDNPPSAGTSTQVAYDAVVSKAGCADVLSGAPQTVVVVNAQPQVTSFTNNGPICSGNTATLTATISGPTTGNTVFYQIQGNPGAGTFSATGGSTVSWSVAPVTTTTYVITEVRNANGCSTVYGAGGPSTTVTVNNGPASGNIPTPAPVCQGGTLIINANPPTGGYPAGATFQWYKNGVAVLNGPTGQGSTIAGANTTQLVVANVQPQDAGQYYLQVCDPAITVGCQCSFTNVVTAVVNPLPNATFAPTNQNICPGQSTVVGVTFTGTAPFALNYTVTSPSGGQQTFTLNSNSTTSAITFPATNTGGVYTYSINFVQDANCIRQQSQGATSTATVTVSTFTVTAAPASSTLNCATDVTSVTATPGGAGTGTITYTLTGTDVFGNTVNRGPLQRSFTASPNSVTFTNVSPGTYTVTATNGGSNPCTVSVPVVINSPAPITGTAQTTAPISCAGGTTTVRGTVTGGNAVPAGTYSVTLVNAAGAPNYGPTTSVGGQFTITNVTAGTYSVVAQDANGCTRTIQQLIVFQPAPITVTATPGVTRVTCFGQTTVINVTATGGSQAGTYTYTLSGGPTGGTIANQPGTQTATFQNVAAGTYTVTATDQNGCQGFATVNITSPAQLAGTATVTQPTCPGGNGSITISNVTGGTAPYRYSLSGGTAGATPAGGTNSTTFTFSNLAPGTYTPTIIDANNCVQPLGSFTITPPPSITGTVDFAPIQCFGGSTTVTINNIAGGNGVGPIQYTITGFNSAGQPVTITTNTGNNLYPVPAGTYTITANNPGCPAQPIGSNLTPVGNLVIGQPVAITVTRTAVTYTPACNPTGGNVTLTATAAGGNTFTYQLVNATTGQVFGTNTTGVFNNIPSGTYNYVITNNTTGCVVTSNASQGQQIVVAVPAAFTMNTPQVQNAQCVGGTGTVTVSATGGTGTRTFTLTNASGGTLVQSGTGSVTFNPAPGTYTLTAVDANGCPATNNGQTITVQPAVGTGTADLTINGTAPVNTVAGPTNVFPAQLGTSMRITYTVTNLSAPLNIAANGIFVRIPRINPNFSLTLDPTFAENSNWTLTTTAGFWTLNYVGTQSQLACGPVPTSARFQILFTQNAANGRSAFPLSATVDHAGGDPYPFNNQWTTRLETSQ